MATSTITKAADYKKIVFTVGFDSESIVADARGFAVNGVVQINLTLKEGLTSGWHNGIQLTIPEKYRPVDVIYGARRLTAIADSSIGLFTQLNGDVLQVSVDENTTGQTYISFVYPQSSI